MIPSLIPPLNWQRYITQTLQGIVGVCVFFDDIRIQGSNLKPYQQNLKESSFEYLGYFKRYSKKGLKD